MIKEDYVSFEVAKLLKEKGFNGEWHKYYWGYFPGKEFLTEGSFSPEYDYPAPTQQMAMKWLRETTNYELNVFCSEVDKNFKRGYSYDIFNVVDAEEKSHQEHGFNTYEDAVEAALEYVLKNLI